MISFALVVAVALADTPDGGSPPPPPADAPAMETVVTATRAPRPVREVTSTVTVIPKAELERSPGVRIDDVLRAAVPSFATFRRTSSVAADPTAQGVNLRNVGPSGVSRALVLLDGVPVNDPFGGWVYWRALPRLGLERVELAPGAASALYGSAALGGVVELFSRGPLEQALDLDLEWGTRRSLDVALRAADRWGKLGAELEGEHFSTAGYPVVAPSQAGAADLSAPSEHESVSARMDYSLTSDLTASARGQYFDERENGGTAHTSARVRQGSGSFGARWHTTSAGDLEARLWLQGQLFQQDRARLTPDRASEFLAGHQENPSDSEGASLLWTSRPLDFHGRHFPAAGADAFRVSGRSAEDLFPATITPSATVRRDSSGSQVSLGVFAQDSYQPIPDVEVLAALRLDAWQNADGRRHTVFGDDSTADATFTDRSASQLSPRVGVRWQALPFLTARGSAYQAFRAPTLNELYRPFQVGTVLTASNPDLGPERLTGAEAGLDVELPFGLAARATGFWNRLTDPIVNVTLAAPIDGATRQRQNVGAVQIAGVEGWLDLRLWRAFSASAGYTFAPTRVLSAASDTLVGKQLPHAPARRATIQLSYDDPRIVTVTLAVRYVGQQFEDDLNTLPLDGVALVDLSARRRLFGDLDAYVTVNNLLNQQYLVGRAGIDTVGEPLTVLAGLRYRLGH
jgi:outer membrane receptor protein involved in Fe transport